MHSIPDKKNTSKPISIQINKKFFISWKVRNMFSPPWVKLKNLEMRGPTNALIFFTILSGNTPGYIKYTYGRVRVKIWKKKFLLNPSNVYKYYFLQTVMSNDVQFSIDLYIDYIYCVAIRRSLLKVERFNGQIVTATNWPFQRLKWSRPR